MSAEGRHPRTRRAARTRRLARLLAERAVVLDGAMGTLLGRGGASTDTLNLTDPGAVSAAHAAYLAAGADVIRTNTFNAPFTGDDALAAAGAHLARAAADAAEAAASGRPRFVGGVLGPPPAPIPADELAAAYGGAAAALVEGGVDLFVIETVTHIDAAAAALDALAALFAARGRRWPVIVSATLAAEGARLAGGEPLGDFLRLAASAEPLAVGLNCGFGAAHLAAHAAALAAARPAFASLHPNAGLPDSEGRYPDGPEAFAAILAPLVRAGTVRLAGGCCGTTPAHIRALAEAIS